MVTLRPIDVRCPRCEKPVGTPCYPNGRHHDERITAATLTR